MSQPSSPTTPQAEWAGRSGGSSPLAAVPSWLVSLALHAGLLLLIASGLKSCEGLPNGDADGGMRQLGLHVRESNSSADRTSDNESTDEAVPFQQPLDNDVQQPLIDQNPPSDLQTPRIDRPADVIGLGPGAVPSSANSAVEAMILPNGAAAKPGRIGDLDKGETSFFGIKDSATQFAYVLDASGSMAGTAMLAAKAELKKSIEALDATQRFQILFYTQTPRVMKLPNSSEGSLVWATTINKTLARQDVDSVSTSGGTDHMPALKKALRMRPEVIYFLTDADEPILSAADLNDLKELNQGRTRIHCVEFGKGPDLKIENFLGRLARQNGGTYRYRDVMQFERKR